LLAFVIGTLTIRAAAESDSATASPASTERPPTILSVRSPDGKDVPYGKVYGDFDAPPIPRMQANAEYSPELKSKGLQGAAIVKFTLTAKGEMKDFSIQASQAEFGKAALAAAGRSKYKPAEKAKKRVECRMELLYTFPGPFVAGGTTP
jgi:TonB family protein